MNWIHFSQTIAYALRHRPEDFGLTPNDDGSVELDELLTALRKVKSSWGNVQADDIHEAMVRSDKKRFEIVGSKIRAYYGHSYSKTIEYEAAVPPEFLYHGTNPAYWTQIRLRGLLPMKRQRVHLSSTLETARMVGKRWGIVPLILRISTQAAASAGIVFYHGNDDVWLADAIPPQYIQLEEFPAEFQENTED